MADAPNPAPSTPAPSDPLPAPLTDNQPSPQPTPAQDPAPQPADDAAQDALKQFSRETGQDFSGFPNVEAARAAYNRDVQRWAALGLQQQPQQQPPAHQPEPEEVDEADEDDVDDLPEVPKPNKRQTKRERALEKRLALLEQRDQERAVRQYQQEQVQFVNQTLSAIDALDNPRFGVGTSRNQWQVNDSRLLAQTAWGIQRGAAAQGVNLPVEQAVRAAARHLGVDLDAKPTEENPTPPPNAQPTPRSGNSGLPSGNILPAVPVDERYGKLADYVNDPEFRAAAARIGK